MGNVMADSGLTTKIRAMQAKLLTQADYETISGFTDVVQVVEFLKTKPAYAVYMDQLELAHLHRGDIEKMLYQSLYNDYTRIFRFAGIDQKKFLMIYWMKYEVSVINYCLRIVFNHYDKPYDLDYKKEFFDKYSINTDISKTTRYIGYSIQQYSKRKFKNGERPTQAYEKVINSFHAEIEKALGKFVKDGIESEELKLGDVPYVYSIIPLSQTANTPIFELSYATGVRGNQTSSVENYKKYLNTLAENFIKNVGE